MLTLWPALVSAAPCRKVGMNLRLNLAMLHLLLRLLCRLIKPQEHPTLWDELPEPAGMVV